jgi:hypothetical protein
MKPQTSGLVVGKLKRKVLREPVGVGVPRGRQKDEGKIRKEKLGGE